MDKKNKINSVNIKNKKAFFNYEIVESIVAGIVLQGAEIKSIVQGKISFTDSYCDFIENELWLKNFHISEYENATLFEPLDPKRDRKLLLTRQQLNKFKKKYEERGLTIVPLKIYTNDRGLIKFDIALVRGKKLYDKKNSITEREQKITIKRDFNVNL
jgi:SsrA-binding protein